MVDTFVANVSEVGRMKFVKIDMKTSLAVFLLRLFPEIIRSRAGTGPQG